LLACVFLVLPRWPRIRSAILFCPDCRAGTPARRCSTAGDPAHPPARADVTTPSGPWLPANKILLPAFPRRSRHQEVGQASRLPPRGWSVLENSRARDPDGRGDACPTLRKLFGHSATAQGRRAAAREDSGWRTADGKTRRRGDSCARTINLARNARGFNDRLSGGSSCARPPRGEGRRKNEECRKGAKPPQSHIRATSEPPQSLLVAN
jgi:hypothetical protein